MNEQELIDANRAHIFASAGIVVAHGNVQTSHAADGIQEFARSVFFDDGINELSWSDLSAIMLYADSILDEKICSEVITEEIVFKATFIWYMRNFNDMGEDFDEAASEVLRFNEHKGKTSIKNINLVKTGYEVILDKLEKRK